MGKAKRKQRSFVDLLASAREYEEKAQYDKAYALYEEATEVYPDEVMGWVCRGALEDEISRHGTGLFGGKESFGKALQLRIIPSILNDYGNILLRNELRWKEAEKFYREAVIRHGMMAAAQNLAVCLLNTATVKKTPEGWCEAWQWYEQRELHKLKDHDLLWRGEPLAGKRLMIQFEQGFGDHVWAMRFVKQAHDEGATTICVAQPNTLRLLMSQDYVDEVYNIQEDSQFEADYVTMLLSMPGYMLPNSMPVTVGKYIDLPAQVVGTKPRVGICWHGSVDKGYQAWRNIELDKLMKPLKKARPDIEFVSLLKGKHAGDHPHIDIDRTEVGTCNDLWDTANLINSLDLVISTDTMIPHLSAALGIETWILDRWSSCWQFGIQGPDSDPHWYEHAEVFRQIKFNDWTPVIEEITERLKKWELS